MLRFLIDTQLPFSLASKLKEFDFDAIHTTYFNAGHLMNDSEIRRIAIEQNRIIITKDTDFMEYYIVKGAPPKVFLLEIGNISNKQLFQLIETNHHWITVLFAHQNADMVICQNDKLVSY